MAEGTRRAKNILDVKRGVVLAVSKCSVKNRRNRRHNSDFQAGLREERDDRSQRGRILCFREKFRWRGRRATLFRPVIERHLVLKSPQKYRKKQREYAEQQAIAVN